MPNDQLIATLSAWCWIEGCKLERIAQEAALAAAAATAAAAAENDEPKPRGPPPLLRSRTLPAIVVPGINILQAQIDAKASSGGGKDVTSSTMPRFSFTDTNTLDPRKHLAHHRLSSPETGGGVKETLPHGRLSTPTLHKLARFLNQSPPVDSANRRLSWESRYPEEDGGLPRSSSIDSMVESRHCNPLSRRLPSPLLSTRVPQQPLSPSVARRMKGARATNGKSQTVVGTLYSSSDAQGDPESQLNKVIYQDPTAFCEFRAKATCNSKRRWLAT